MSSPIGDTARSRMHHRLTTNHEYREAYEHMGKRRRFSVGLNHSEGNSTCEGYDLLKPRVYPTSQTVESTSDEATHWHSQYIKSQIENKRLAAELIELRSHGSD